MMTERQLARNMTLLLDRGVDELDPAMLERLDEARRRALGLLPATAAPGARSGAWRAWRYALAPLVRGAAALLLVGAVVVGAQYWKGEQSLRESSAVDAALLGDDLPIDAYLDAGFRTWLAEDARS